MFLGTMDGLARMGQSAFHVVTQKASMRDVVVYPASSGLDLSFQALMSPARIWPMVAMEARIRLPRSLDSIYILGADMFDGSYAAGITRFYCWLSGWMARRGVSATIVGCSFNKAIPGAIDAIRNLDAAVRLCVRDPVSVERLRNEVSRPCEEVRDVAFLMDPDPGSHQNTLESFRRAQKAGGRYVVGLCVNPLTMADSDDFLRTLFRRLAGRQVAWMMLGHDTRAGNDDFAVAEKAAELARRAGFNAYALPGSTRAREVKFATGLCDLVVSGRLHLCIAALGMSVPAIGLAYLGKFEGLFREVGLDRQLLDATTANADDLAAAILGVIDQRRELTERVRRAVPALRSSAVRNLATAEKRREESV
jgi:polysaccharide pyruvyl transferase WcaK-like protein